MSINLNSKLSKPSICTFVSLIVITFCNTALGVPHHQGTISSVNLGARYSSVLQNRGLVLYRDFQIDPVVGVFLFDDRLEFLGDSIGYRDFVFSDKVRLRTKLNAISDKPLFPANAAIRDASPQRLDTYEWTSQIEVFLPGYNDKYLAELDLGFAKDISIHHGHYFNLLGKFKLFDFQIPNGGPKVEPNVFADIGFGDGLHNRYFYGPSADASGFNNLSVGIWFALPLEADRAYPIVQLKHFEVLGERNRNAELAVGRNEGWLFSFIATYGILE